MRLLPAMCRCKVARACRRRGLLGLHGLLHRRRASPDTPPARPGGTAGTAIQSLALRIVSGLALAVSRPAMSSLLSLILTVRVRITTTARRQSGGSQLWPGLPGPRSVVWSPRRVTQP